MVEEDMIQQANLAAERLEKVNSELAERIKKLEAIETRSILGGKTNAGEPQKPELSEADKIKAEGARYFKGGMLEGVFK